MPGLSGPRSSRGHRGEAEELGDWSWPLAGLELRSWGAGLGSVGWGVRGGPGAAVPGSHLGIMPGGPGKPGAEPIPGDPCPFPGPRYVHNLGWFLLLLLGPREPGLRTIPAPRQWPQETIFWLKSAGPPAGGSIFSSLCEVGVLLLLIVLVKRGGRRGGRKDLLVCK